MRFRWDPEKAAANERKHGITFHEAASVFSDPLAITYLDPDHSIGEERLITFGCSRRGRLLIVAHCHSGTMVRIISARRMTNAERRLYEED
jgi:uncharacterized protein